MLSMRRSSGCRSQDRLSSSPLLVSSSSNTSSKTCRAQEIAGETLRQWLNCFWAQGSVLACDQGMPPLLAVPIRLFQQVSGLQEVCVPN